MPLALTAAAASSYAQTVSFIEDANVITGLTLDGVTLSATSHYTSNSLQFRIYDIFPAGSPFTGTFFEAGSILFEIDGIAQPLLLGSFGITSQSVGGTAETDSIFWLQFADDITLSPGNIVTLSGDTLATGTVAGVPLLMPTSGRYDAYLINSSNSGMLSDAIQVNVIPEPSTYALLLGAGALGAVLLHRRGREAVA